MKLVDILFVLTAAAATNAILIPTDNNGSPKASGTSSRVSDPTNEPNPVTSNEYQQDIIDATNLSIFDEDWKYLFDLIDPSTSNEDWQQPIDQPSSSTFSQVSGTADKPDSNIPKDWQQPIDVASPSTPKRSRKRPIDEPGSNISKQSRKQSTDQPGPSASKQSRKQSTDQPGPGITDKDWQRLIDEVNSDAFEDWKELFDIAGLNTPSQVSDSIDQSSPSTFDKYQQQPADQPSPSTFNQDQQHLMDATGLNISDQDQQQSMGQGESANTVSNQIAGLCEKYQETFDRIKQKFVESKEIRKKKLKEYCDYEALRFEQWSALERGKEISGSRYDPKVEDQLKQEYATAGKKVWELRYQLKRFMKRHGLKFEEPN
ncbi:hypothetical protein BATDEDRAFT_92883 [Batrachochytrium dendrobatidis JAM81]|uniref:Uncharacterized protein n=2 Tax=Batrachochytrium dendrobatidis TaxID=109871 RepID=F4PET2_BATDJ|nr:uncharacterized protein BATDEDRAFT_92883 [Batrachochytrium dendrobatidis JAM81]EGF76302.1 hypothetical protein BATDEDRAFT_92883 [Batrachochytrium dendrobatidis JAM81]OAJ42971.1 hypothetical protein BDEG_26357 [Batrachochytrium dendrobatidis JEL423]|eukprot:XP_006683112.1 hypothetical protein BATDEDRAFT_92883 [Batrachochytrium dendrobatidis JAM81]